MGAGSTTALRGQRNLVCLGAPLPWAAKMGDTFFPGGPDAMSQGLLRLQDIRGASLFSDTGLFWDLWSPRPPWLLSFSFSANSVPPLGVGLC